jgi:ATP-dependent RNA helicase SUPV3L1/SUV3
VASFAADGELLIQGLRAGRLHGFRFEPDPAARSGARSLLAAANRAVRGGIDAQIARLEAAPDAEIAMSGDGVLSWRDAPVARLVPGDEALAPRLQVLRSELLDTPRRKRVRARLRRWLDARLEADLGPLLALRRAELPPSARGIAFAIGQGLGSLPRRPVSEQVAALQGGERSALHRLGVRIGRESLYLPLLLTRAAVRTRGLLWGVAAGHDGLPVLDARDSLAVDPRLPRGFYEACGYGVRGDRALRVDALERLALAARERAARGPFAPAEDLARLAGLAAGELPHWLEALGYPATGDGRHAGRSASRRKRRGRARRRPPRAAPIGSASEA